MYYSYVHMKPEEEIEMHKQKTWELSCVLFGSGYRQIGNIKEDFDKDEIILIPPEMPHYWKFNKDDVDAKGKIENISVMFSQETLNKLSEIFPEIKPTLDNYKDITDAIKIEHKFAYEVIGILRKMKNQTPMERVISLMKILNLIPQAKEQKVVGKFVRGNKESLRLEQIRTYLVCNAQRNITLNAIAQHVGMNRSSFCIFFKRATGTTFVDYLNAYRIAIACEFMEETNDTIAEICYRSGFNNVPYFNRLFRKIKGMPPRKWQKTRQKQEADLKTKNNVLFPDALQYQV